MNRVIFGSISHQAHSTHTISKNINKNVWQYYSSSSLIARPLNGLLLCFVVEQTILSCQILVSSTDCSFAYDHFQKMRHLAQGQEKIELTVDIRCIGISGKVACSTHPKVDLLFHRNVWKRGIGRGLNVPRM